MDNRNKRYVLLFVFIGIVVHLLFIGCSSDRSTDKAHANNEQNDETGKAEQSVSTEETDEVELNPFGNTVQKEDITEAHILQYIHYMSHQKVKAERKWGFYEITDERIQWLLDALDESGYNPNGKYREILTRWANGDFSQIDKDHNYVWKIQGGTKEEEKATGILSEEEEKEYIENTEDLAEDNIRKLGTFHSND